MKTFRPMSMTSHFPPKSHFSFNVYRLINIKLCSLLPFPSLSFSSLHYLSCVFLLLSLTGIKFKLDTDVDSLCHSSLSLSLSHFQDNCACRCIPLSLCVTPYTQVIVNKASGKESFNNTSKRGLILYCSLDAQLVM